MPEGWQKVACNPAPAHQSHASQAVCAHPPRSQGPTYHDAVVDEATAVAGRLQVGVLFRAGHSDVPHLLPGLVQLHVHRVHARVVGCHCVPHVCGNAVLLRRGWRGQGEHRVPALLGLIPLCRMGGEIRGQNSRAGGPRNHGTDGQTEAWEGRSCAQSLQVRHWPNWDSNSLPSVMPSSTQERGTRLGFSCLSGPRPGW